MAKTDIRTYQDACVWVVNNEFVDVDGRRVPMHTLPDWVAGIEIMMAADAELGGTEGSPDELIRMVMSNLPLSVMRARCRRELT